MEKNPEKKKKRALGAMTATGVGLGVGGGILAAKTSRGAKEGKAAIEDAKWRLDDNKNRLKWLEKQKKNNANLQKIVENPELNSLVDKGKSILDKVSKDGSNFLGDLTEAAKRENINVEGIVNDGKKLYETVTNPHKSIINSIIGKGKKFLNSVVEKGKEYQMSLPEIEKEIAERSGKTEGLKKNFEKVVSENSGILKKNKLGKRLALAGTTLAATGGGSMLIQRKKNKEKNFSEFKEKRDDDGVRYRHSDKAILDTGKIGLATGGAVIGAAGYHAVKGGQHIAKGISLGKEAIKSQEGRKAVREVINNTVDKYAPFGSADFVKDKINDLAELKGKLGKSTVGKIELASNYAKYAAKAPRWISNNAHLAVGKGVNEFKERNRKNLTTEQLKALDKIAPATKEIGRGASYLRNARFLGKVGVGVGAAGGALYLHGRQLRDTGHNKYQGYIDPKNPPQQTKKKQVL